MSRVLTPRTNKGMLCLADIESANDDDDAITALIFFAIALYCAPLLSFSALQMATPLVRASSGEAIRLVTAAMLIPVPLLLQCPVSPVALAHTLRVAWVPELKSAHRQWPLSSWSQHLRQHLSLSVEGSRALLSSSTQRSKPLARRTSRASMQSLRSLWSGCNRGTVPLSVGNWYIDCRRLRLKIFWEESPCAFVMAQYHWVGSSAAARNAELEA